MKVLLLILDGWGYSSHAEGNAIAEANLPTIHNIESQYPWGLLKSSGIAVGLPWAEAGNSEVGHLTLGLGRTVLQSMPRIIKAIQDGSFFTNPALAAAAQNVKTHSSQFHIMGLLGTASVHSYIDHLYGLLEFAKRSGISSRVKLHLFTDGKDSPPQEALRVFEHLKMRLDEGQGGVIASFIGRDYAMDRDDNWVKTEDAFNLLVKGEGRRQKNEEEALREYYRQGISDNNIPPTVMMQADGMPRGIISPHDSVVFFNYRADSARQLTKTFILPQSVSFAREVPSPLCFVTMTEYEKSFPCKVAFNAPVLDSTLSETLSSQKKTQLHIAETEKYAHVTYFFNGMREIKYPGEEWMVIPSLGVEHFISEPELKTPEIGKAIIEALGEGKYDFILANFASADLLAHSGNIDAAARGCEAIDAAIKKIIAVLEIIWGKGEECALLITSDHGHAESMRNPISGKVLTGHTSNDVPFYLVNPRFKGEFSPLYMSLKNNIGMLADVAPTVLDLLNIPKPPQMIGTSLLRELGWTGR